MTSRCNPCPGGTGKFSWNHSKDTESGGCVAPVAVLFTIKKGRRNQQKPFPASPPVCLDRSRHKNNRARILKRSHSFSAHKLFNQLLGGNETAAALSVGAVC